MRPPWAIEGAIETMIQLTCPNCGERNANEFHYGGEYNPRPDDTTRVSQAEWADYLYNQINSMDEQVEWWYHRSGCQLWFLAERHRQTNEVSKTYMWGQQ